MQKTAYEWRISDWSSDVCSSVLVHGGRDFRERGGEVKFLAVQAALPESRAAARSWPMSGSRAFSSGPWSSPVSARRSGRKSYLPLRPEAAFTAAVQLTQVASSDRKRTRLNSVTNAHLVCRLLLEEKK